MPRNNNFKNLLKYCNTLSTTDLIPKKKWIHADTLFEFCSNKNDTLTKHQTSFVRQLLTITDTSPVIYFKETTVKEGSEQRVLKWFLFLNSKEDKDPNPDLQDYDYVGSLIPVNNPNERPNKRRKIGMSAVVTPERGRLQQKVAAAKMKESKVSNTDTLDVPYVCTTGSQVMLEDPLTLLCRVASLHQDSNVPQEQQEQPNNHPIQTEQQPNHPIQTETVNCPIQTQTVHQQTVIQQFITNAEQLNFDVTPRKDPRHPSLPDIPVDVRLKTITSDTKWSILVRVTELGYERLSKKEKEKLAHAVTRYHSYLGGYPTHLGQPSTFLKWYNAYQTSKRSGSSDELFKDKRGSTKRKRYVTYIEDNFPCFLHSCFRYASNVIGADASIPTLSHYMNEKAKMENEKCEVRSNLKMTRHHFREFFEKFGGVIKEPTPKPRLTNEHIRNRLKFAKKHRKRIKSELRKGYICCYLDEKWFYITSRRKKIKFLPAHRLEDAVKVFQSQPKTRSRRFPTKVMMMGIVSKPYPEKKFDGKILLKRVSEWVETKRISHSQKISDSYHINGLIKAGEWKSTCYVDSITLTNLFDHLYEVYSLDEAIVSRLCLSYSTHAKSGKHTKSVKRIKEDDKNEYVLKNRTYINKNGIEMPLTLNDLTLHVELESGAQVEKDITCDSQFMMDSIFEIGTAIQSSFHWVPRDVPIYI